MSLIIDGFNLIYKFPKFESHMANGNLTKAMNGLTQTLQDYCSITQKKLTIVYDGKKEMGNNIQHEKIGSINIYYSLDVIADDIIKKFIKEKVNPKMSTVVTSDKKLIFYLNIIKKIHSIWQYFSPKFPILKRMFFFNICYIITIKFFMKHF